MSPRDRSIAASAHISGIFFPILGPAAVFAISRRSNPFAAYHAVHAIMGEIVLKAFLLVLGIASLGYTIYTFYGHYQTDFRNWSWPYFIGKMALTWLAVTILGVINTLGALRTAHRAFQGNTLRPGRVDRLARGLSGLTDRMLQPL
ncbi:hypothetical protein EON79_05530 [bacterium]|nr:MAG: hypothetical protein EON79_05530 [bacterium]